ncbi:retropepsin-like aspartic protease [Alicyclobacillus sp. SO9]|uniref:retropepsin-like aspartic protease n=1 Tax=Alicyclobacillus sp. SO9 TaxID=2665646 RepID=UPI0018E8818F|nr:retropepsin-like aspartic protease [Alicyclobacillus sp. SO9]QQE81613.1 retropepsin-like domain-containing protein [Alicyclobacillus sp. SO9]
MEIKLDGGLVLCSLTLQHHGKQQIINNMVLDTGSSETLIYRHAVEDLDIHLEDEDEFVFMRGIGGRETSLRKQVDKVEFIGFTAQGFRVDFTDVDDNYINGLVGLDLLTAGHFIINLDTITLVPAAHT